MAKTENKETKPVQEEEAPRAEALAVETAPQTVPDAVAADSAPNVKRPRRIVGAPDNAPKKLEDEEDRHIVNADGVTIRKDGLPYGYKGPAR